MNERDLRAELAREDALRRVEGIPAASRLAVRRRLAESSKPGRRKPVHTWLLAGALALGGLALVVWRPSAPEQTLAGFEISARTGDLRVRVQDASLAIAAGEVTLLAGDEAFSLRNRGPLTLRREGRAVRVLRGRVEVSVSSRPPSAAPVTVLVSGGAIQVMGTRFTVDQGQDGGSVTLHEGAIRFEPAGGTPVSLHAGERLDWPLPPVPRRSVAAPEQALPPSLPTPRTPHARSADALLEEVDVLRSRGEYERAVQVLSEGARLHPPATAERLSFELGSILTYQLRDARRACTQWAAHGRRFAQGSYAKDVRRARAALRCGKDDLQP